MDWRGWLIPLVVIIVVVISNLARIAQDEKKKKTTRRRPGPGDNVPRPRRTQSDAERFLEEIDRRRREAGEQRKVPLVQQKAVPHARAPRRETPTAAEAMPTTVPVTRRAALPVPAREIPMPSRRQPSPKPLPQSGQITPILEEIVVATVVPTPVGAGDVSAGAPAAVITVKPHTPTAVMLRQLLRSPDAVKTAIVLREVLDRPLCHRPPRVAARE